MAEGTSPDGRSRRGRAARGAPGGPGLKACCPWARSAGCGFWSRMPDQARPDRFKMFTHRESHSLCRDVMRMLSTRPHLSSPKRPGTGLTSHGLVFSRFLKRQPLEAGGSRGAPPRSLQPRQLSLRWRGCLTGPRFCRYEMVGIVKVRLRRPAALPTVGPLPAWARRAGDSWAILDRSVLAGREPGATTKRPAGFCARSASRSGVDTLDAL